MHHSAHYARLASDGALLYCRGANPDWGRWLYRLCRLLVSLKSLYLKRTVLRRSQAIGRPKPTGQVRLVGKAALKRHVG
jgi:hypothetical protein